ncbi:sporozoite invasion-associated protein 2, putative (SIAP2) [Plasmodium ovale wallikeri]|uniref:Sporozoite invasion-associated protein 2, putative n=2 Tax=Plasmodium ovale TaxID=36330 RepID=A0A1C3KG81_PLAOA|nr:sporozoite invasion-associated protein 2, putative (SIAP2) [Plasmodium ovale wallikeri]SBT32500.1 sporozoite invasion-associated protein 2, putative (SIAP2) [Plasmodium ovale wallikeri]SBT72634.1 sporozoite invasion-associated protein 2, putative [Plasmodium ovale]
MKASTKYHFFFHFLLLINILELCFSSQTELFDESAKKQLKEDYYAPTGKDLFGDDNSYIMTLLEDNIEEEPYVFVEEDHTGDYYTPSKRSFDELFQKIQESKKKKKKLEKKKRTTPFRRSASVSSLSDYDNEEGGGDSHKRSGEPTHQKDYYARSNYKESFEHDSESSYEEIDLESSDDDADEISFGALNFYSIRNPDSTENTETSGMSKNDMENDDDFEQESQETRTHRKRQEKRHKKRKLKKNPFEKLGLHFYSYDDYLKNKNIDQFIQEDKLEGEPFRLNDYYHRVVNMIFFKKYMLNLLFDMFTPQQKEDREYILENLSELELFIKSMLQKNFVCLSYSEEEDLMKDAFELLKKAHKNAQ